MRGASVLRIELEYTRDGFRIVLKGAFFSVSIDSAHRIEDLVPSTLLLLGLGKHFYRLFKRAYQVTL